MPSDALRAAIGRALPCLDRWNGCSTPHLGHPSGCPAHYHAAVLNAVEPLFEALEQDRERLEWVLLILRLTDDTLIGDRRAILLAAELETGKSGRAAIDAARATEADDGE